MMRLLLCLAAVALAFPAAAGAEPVGEATVERSGDSWTIEYRLHERSPVWVFADSTLPREGETSFRQRSWTIVTPGVRLERRGWYDVLVADSGSVPDQVTIRFVPFTDDIEAAYDAALAFTDGSVALYGGKFDLFPVESVAAVEKLPIDPDDRNERKTRLTMRDSGGPVLQGSERVAEAALDETSAYVLFGKLEPVESEALATIVDPQLPDWLSNYITAAIPAVLDRYAERMGPPPGGKPLLLASWAGPTAGRISMGGSVLDSTIVMTFDGEGLRLPNPEVERRTLWFAAHEGAHFWLGNAVTYEQPQDAWITEGGADLLAYRSVAAVNPGFDARAALQEALDTCIAASLKGGIASANERGDHKAYYNCGAIFGLVAETAGGGDFTAFVRDLVESNRDDGKVGRAEWLAALDARAPGKRLGEQIGSLLDRAAPGPEPWALLLDRAGIPHRLDSDGMPKLQ